MRTHWLTTLTDADLELRLVRGAGTRLAVQVEGYPAGADPMPRVRIYPTRGGTGFAMLHCIEDNVVDRAGRLELAGLPDADWHVEVIAPGFTFDPRNAKTAMGETSPMLTFRAIPDGTVELRGVLRSDAGKPLQGQRLLCRTQRSPSMNGGRPGETVTDAEGRFVLIAPLAVGEPYTLHLVDSPYVLQQDSGGPPHHDLRYLVRWRETADPTRELQLVAVPATFVSARLVDRDDHPVPFLWTELEGERERGSGIPRWSAIAYATSVRDGTLRFAGVHALDIAVRVHAEGQSGAGASEPFRMQPGGRHDVVVVIERPGTVKGRVLDGEGRPKAGVRVALRNYDVATGQQTDGGWTNVPTDRDGRFVFTGVAPGGHRLQLGMQRKQDGEAMSAVFEVGAGATVKVDLQAGQ